MSNCSSSKKEHLERAIENQKIKYANNPYFTLEKKKEYRKLGERGVFIKIKHVKH